ncbi:MAG: adenylate/guanylate cyclase domain-containing protein, partial [Deltaproteobacteria bacterium]
TSLFKNHYRDMVVQTIGTGTAFLLLGILVIVFLGIVQRYELAHLAIEKLEKIRRLLGHFVPQTAKNMIEKEPEKRGLLDKYIQDATILFLDIENFSLLVQKYSQEMINRTIETYFSAFLDLFQKNGGDITETAGDGMMVIFQDPDPVQHAKNATQTALQIQEKCLKIKGNGDAALLPIRVNVGIQSGQTYLGSTKMRGSEGERWTFTASGAVTILAARLSEFGHGGQILIGEETAGRVNKFFSLIHIGKVSLKNIKDSGEVFELARPNTGQVYAHVPGDMGVEEEA